MNARFFLISFWLFICSMLSGSLAYAQQKNVCGGEIEKEAWSLWDEGGRKYASTYLIKKRLLDQGDTYALYDLEIIFHNLLSMAANCKEKGRLESFAADWILVYEALESADIAGNSDDFSLEKYIEFSGVSNRWICKGGAICTEKNGLLQKEVALVSMQGLALLIDLANFLVDDQKNFTNETNEKFINLTVNVTLQSLLRWGGEGSISRWNQLAKVHPSDIGDSQSTLFFTDQALWQIGLYASLAGVLDSPYGRKVLVQNNVLINEGAKNFKALLKLFESRLSFSRESLPGSSGSTKVVVADLDRGFWRLYKNNQFAGYSGLDKPVTCFSGESSEKMVMNLDPYSVAPVDDLGWDISHARRLVHVLNSLERNKKAIRNIYDLSDSDLPDDGLAEKFSNQIATKVWNGDKEKPLFTNWMSGANGWYRVAYDNGMSRCIEGYGPWGLSISFPTGGYALWGYYQPLLLELGLAIFDLQKSSANEDKIFLKKYYSGLDRVSSNNMQALIKNIMFYPSLIRSVE